MKGIVAALALAALSTAFAQQGSPSYARMVVIVPKPGQADAFEKGYERHLQWHRGAKDTWTWYGWTFVLGNRINRFMDGTFGHAAADFDAAVQPAADAADNNVNVAPYADFVSHGIYQRVDAMSAGEPLPDASPFLSMTTYHIRPGQEAAVRAGGGARARRGGAPDVVPAAGRRRGAAIRADARRADVRRGRHAGDPIFAVRARRPGGQ